MNDSVLRNLNELSSLDEFLEEEGVLEEVKARAVKRVIALQLQQAMVDKKMSKSTMAQIMGTSRAQLARVLDPVDFNITLETLARAARAVGGRLTVKLE